MAHSTVTEQATAQHHALITAHLGMALRMARKMARRLPGSVSREDVESAALLGLTEAASRYDSTRKEPFMGFAAKRVRGAILDHLRRGDMLTRKGRRNARKVCETKRDLEVLLGRCPEEQEIADALGISQQEFQANYASLSKVGIVYLEELSGEPTGSRTQSGYGTDGISTSKGGADSRVAISRATRVVDPCVLLSRRTYASRNRFGTGYYGVPSLSAAFRINR